MLLVTGSAGFVMGHLLGSWLGRDREARVLAVDCSPMDDTLRRYLGDAHDRVEWILADVRETGSALTPAHCEQIEYLVHGAAVTSIRRLMHAEGSEQPGLDGARDALAANVDGTLAVLALALRLPALRAMINVSSGSVYAGVGPEGVPLPEDECVAPEDLYAISKLSGELFTKFAVNELGLNAASVRLSGVFGPLDRETPSRDVVCVPKRIARAACSGETLRIRSLKAVGDFIHADDVADAIIALLAAPELGEDAYNIAAGEVTTIAELIAYARDLYPALRLEETEEPPFDIDYEPERRSGRWGPYSLQRIQAATGWRPRELKVSFQSYLRYLGDHGITDS